MSLTPTDLSLGASHIQRDQRSGDDTHTLSIVLPVADTEILVGRYVGSGNVRLRDDIHHCPTYLF